MREYFPRGVLPLLRAGEYNNGYMAVEAFLYLTFVGTFLLLFGPFVGLSIALRKGKEKTLKVFRLVLGCVALVCLLCMAFFVPIAMTTKAIYRTPQYNTDIGCVNLLGVPYGDNRVGNVFAWLNVALFLPAAGFSILSAIFPSRRVAYANRYIATPLLILCVPFLWNLAHAYVGTNLSISYKETLVAIALGACLSSGLVALILDRKERLQKNSDWAFVFAYFLLAVFAFLPMGTFATFVPTDSILFGRIQSSWRVFEFSFVQRLYIYIGIAFFVLAYFLSRSDDLNGKKTVLLLLSIGAISSFFTEYGFEGIFDVANGYKVMPTRLPIHLCHTALFVVPLSIAFNGKKVFYFTYFINVFGAFAAMVWPNNGEYTNMFDPSVLLFWWNHMNALCMPLLAVALKVFDRPKMKQMGYSLAAFAVYFVAIMFANGYLSNFVPGYRPGELGSGTDYLFINNDYILGIFGEEAKKMLNVRVQFNSGDLVLVYYPLYQSLFFVGYVGIAFLMWYVYTFFYAVEDAHVDLRMRLKTRKQNALSFKEARLMKTLTPSEETPIRLNFSSFSKRYGSSPKLSVDHLSLCVSGGEIFGFLGPNGAGKSTCIKSAIGIQPLTEGSIDVCGFDITHEPVQAKRLLGYVPDHYALYEKLAGREYIGYVADLYGVSKEDRAERINHYLEAFELTEAFDARMETYSHGMKQKIAIMAALVHDPKVWILDEPLTGLDPQSVFQVKQAMIAHAKKGNVVFFSSHIIDVVERLCTRIAIILEGKIVFEGSMEEVERQHPEGLEAFYMSIIKGGKGA
ncbi:MAG: YwaF family protein [Bacilli bacterium]|nr:YwaF family protein [Bacilli bacterium]